MRNIDEPMAASTHDSWVENTLPGWRSPWKKCRRSRLLTPCARLLIVRPLLPEASRRCVTEAQRGLCRIAGSTADHGPSTVLRVGAPPLRPKVSSSEGRTRNTCHLPALTPVVGEGHPTDMRTGHLLRAEMTHWGIILVTDPFRDHDLSRGHFP